MKRTLAPIFTRHCEEPRAPARGDEAIPRELGLRPAEAPLGAHRRAATAASPGAHRRAPIARVRWGPGLARWEPGFAPRGTLRNLLPMERQFFASILANRWHTVLDSGHAISGPMPNFNGGDKPASCSSPFVGIVTQANNHPAPKVMPSDDPQLQTGMLDTAKTTGIAIAFLPPSHH